MIIVQTQTGGAWICANPFTNATIEFADVTAISRLGTALNTGPEALLIQLETGSIFPSCHTPEVAELVWNDFFVADDFIQIIGWSAAGESGMLAEQLVTGAETLAETVVESGGLGEWVLLILGLFTALAGEAKPSDIDISKATPPFTIETTRLSAAAANSKISKKTLKLQQQKATSTATHSIQWFNSIPNPSSPITVADWGVNGGLFQHLTTSPDPPGTVLHYNGMENLGWYDGAIGFEPPSNGWIILQLPKTRVGINVHEPGRIADIGTPPYYQIWYPGIKDNAWTNPVSDPSQKFVFPTDIVGYKVTIIPQATAETLFLTVNMQVS